MRNLDIADSRAKLEQYTGLGVIGARHAELIGKMPPGGAQAIASRGEVDTDDELLDRAAMESGTD
jgi:argininosuccinate synthase